MSSVDEGWDIRLLEAAATTVIVTKMSLEIKCFAKSDYFAMIASCSHSMLFSNHATNGLVGMLLK